MLSLTYFIVWNGIYAYILYSHHPVTVQLACRAQLAALTSLVQLAALMLGVSSWPH